MLEGSAWSSSKLYEFLEHKPKQTDAAGTLLASAPLNSISLPDVNPFFWSQVVQAIGASETNLLDTSGPKRVDGEAAVNLVKAADKLGVLQYVMVTSLGTGKFGWPASELGSFARG